MKTRMLGAVALGLLAAACGTNPQERVTGGAAAGAATGAGVGALGGPVGALAGAGIGAAAGAATGAATTPDQVNLGRPLWNDPEVRVPGDNRRGSASSGRGMAARSGETRQLQQALSQRGFDVGPIDGVYGPRTRQAVMDWQRQNNMQATGQPSSQMYSSLGIAPAASGSRSSTAQYRDDRDRAYMGGGMVGTPNSGTGSNTGTTGSSMGGGTTMPNRNPTNLGTGSATGSGSTVGPAGSTGGSVAPGGAPWTPNATMPGNNNQNNSSGASSGSGEGSGSGSGR